MRRARHLAQAPSANRAQRLCAAALALFALAACTAPAPASAAGEPQIVAAGIDATDRFIVSWQLAPETTFDFLEVSTVSMSNPFVPGSFAGKNVVASACVTPGEGCLAPPLLAAFRSTDPVSRDRRYFVKVNARQAARGPLSSAIWVIDQGKPTIPGGGRPADVATNKPVLGMPYKAPARRTIVAPKLDLPSPPRTIDAVLRDGVQARVSCPRFVCYAVVALQLGKTTLVFSDTTVRANGVGAFVFRPRPNRRALLQRRRRARLQVFADILQPGDKRTQITRRFTVRR